MDAAQRAANDAGVLVSPGKERKTDTAYSTRPRVRCWCAGRKRKHRATCHHQNPIMQMRVPSNEPPLLPPLPSTSDGLPKTTRCSWRSRSVSFCTPRRLLPRTTRFGGGVPCRAVVGCTRQPPQRLLERKGAQPWPRMQASTARGGAAGDGIVLGNGERRRLPSSLT